MFKVDLHEMVREDDRDAARQYRSFPHRESSSGRLRGGEEKERRNGEGGVGEGEGKGEGEGDGEAR